MKALLSTIAVACLAGRCMPSLAEALPTRAVQPLVQSGHSAWRTQDGAFDSPNGIAQDKDGYLWIATTSGLVRFDGARFVRWNHFPEGSIADWRIETVYAAKDGSLWIGSTTEIAQLKDGHLARHAIVGRAVRFVEDTRGSLWFVHNRLPSASGPLCRVATDRVECIGAPQIPLPHASVLARSADDDLWIGSSRGLCRWAPGRIADCFLPEALKPLEGLEGVTSLLIARDDTVWVGIGRPGRELGLGKLAGHRWQPLSIDGLDGSTLAVSAILEDRRGSVWIGTMNQGVYRIHDGHAEHFGAENGLSGNTVSEGGLLEDAEGTVWVATSSGLDAFRELSVTVFSTSAGLVSDNVESVLPARDGTVWLGNLSLAMLRADHPAPPPLAAFFEGKAITSMLEDHAGHLWIGVENALYVMTNGALKEVTGPDGDPLGVIHDLAEDASHDVWAKNIERPNRIFRIRDRTVVDEVGDRLHHPQRLVPDPTGGLWLLYLDGSIARFEDGTLRPLPADDRSRGRPNDAVNDADGALLVATDKGLLLQTESSRLLLDGEHGLPCVDLFAVVKDRDDNAWISASCGLIALSRASIDRWRADPASRVAVRLLDVTDGFQPGRGVFQPAARLGADGRLWFANGKIAQVVDPTALTVHSQPPPVRIEDLIADRDAYPVNGDVRLPPGPRNIDIRFTALSFVVPQKIQFQYQLEGRDKDWRSTGGLRQVSYTDLRPGNYRFRVKAGNSDGVWNEQGASVAFEIPPLFHQTGWFIALVVLAGAATLFAFYVVRLRQVAARIRDRLAAKHDERERIARDLHDTLLQATQGLVYRVQAAANRLAPEEAARRMIEQALERADDVIVEGRQRIEALRSKETIGNLFEALRRVGDELASGGDTRFEAGAEGTPRRLKIDVEDELHSIGREALTNAFQHANATVIALQVVFGDDTLRLRIRDDGVGMDLTTPAAGARAGHWGLPGMRERARALGARLELRSRPGAGTELEVIVPTTLAYRSRTSRRRWSWLRRAEDRR